MYLIYRYIDEFNHAELFAEVIEEQVIMEWDVPYLVMHGFSGEYLLALNIATVVLEIIEQYYKDENKEIPEVDFNELMECILAESLVENNKIKFNILDITEDRR